VQVELTQHSVPIVRFQEPTNKYFAKIYLFHRYKNDDKNENDKNSISNKTLGRILFRKIILKNLRQKIIIKR
jgi:hypothetical protein